MSDWNPDDLAPLEGNDELRLASSREDGSLRPYVPIWFVVVEGSLYVRSAYGPDNGWYRRSAASGSGAIKVRGWQRAVAFDAADPGVTDVVSRAYRAKYARYPAGTLATVLTGDAEACTLRVRPG